MAKILYIGTAGSDDPTRAGLPFNFAIGALEEAGHHPEIFLAGEAAYLMKDAVMSAVQPVAMPALKGAQCYHSGLRPVSISPSACAASVSADH